MSDEWQRLLDEQAAIHGTPGAVLAVAVGEEVTVASTGVANVTTGVPVTPDTVFQIGSITKVWTAALAMQLVEQGQLDLDAPVAGYLPELAEAADGRIAEITTRHLLTHTSGLECDLFAETGRGDDVLARHVPLVAASTLMFPPGSFWSYCNSGFILAGRVLEVVSGLVWDELLQQRLIGPLGLARTGTLPEQVLLHSAAMGHVHTAGEQYRRAPVWHLPRVVGPAGTISSTAADLLAFARLHTRGGLAPDGGRVLSEQSVLAMAARTFPLPPQFGAAGPDSWGIGWGRGRWDGARVLRHSGGTVGQYSYLEVVPERDLVLILLTNGGAAEDLVHALRWRILPELFGLARPQVARPSGEPGGQAPVGRYERYGTSVEIGVADGGEVSAQLVAGPEETGDGEHTVQLRLLPGGEGKWLFQLPGSGLWSPLWPVAVPGGRAGVMAGSRLMLKAD